MLIDDQSYGLGYDAGWQEGREAGYNDGWTDAMKEYDERAETLQARIVTLEALLHSVSRGG